MKNKTIVDMRGSIVGKKLPRKKQWGHCQTCGGDTIYHIPDPDFAWEYTIAPTFKFCPHCGLEIEYIERGGDNDK